MIKPVRMKDFTLHLGASEEIFVRANTLRKSLTEAEKILWKVLRNKKFKGYKFRRQHPIDRFIADFYCHQAKLIIEVDGGIHDLSSIKEHDDDRTYELEKLGIKVIRFNNYEIIHQLEKVLQQIKDEIDSNKP
jgi:very-short-patch-repair endonuclease